MTRFKKLRYWWTKKTSFNFKEVIDEYIALSIKKGDWVCFFDPLSYNLWDLNRLIKCLWEKCEICNKKAQHVKKEHYYCHKHLSKSEE